MNPGNGIETGKRWSTLSGWGSFLFMNPGNGIETTISEIIEYRDK